MAKSAQKETMLVACVTCDARVSATIEGSYYDYFDGPGFDVRFVLLRCPECKTPLLATQDNEDARYGDADGWSKPSRLYPEVRQRQLGSSVPELIRKAFDEAMSCNEARAYTACAIMCRKVLEGVCDHFKANGNNLASRLKSLYDDGELDKRLFDWITALRMAGNEAAHDVKITVSKEDASDLLDFTEAVAEYLFTFKEKYQEFEARREKRKARSSATKEGVVAAKE